MSSKKPSTETLNDAEEPSKIDIEELDRIIQSVEFPDDYDAFDDELLDMIP